MIAVEKLGLKQGEFSLCDLNFEIPVGKYGVLVGKSGCGKTTLLEAVCGLRPINSGRILLGGQDVTSCKPGERKTEPSQISRRVEELADRLCISHLLNRMPDALSGGECQRVALGRALSIRPKFLCLDEPLSALDEETYDEIFELLLQTVKGTGVTVLQITHNKREVDNLADLVFRMNGNALSQER
jgi:molybdate/tungstate transport system ATP-binding protein